MNGNSKRGDEVRSGDLNWVQLVEEMVKKTEFGVVQLIIHNSRVVRIERTEKMLLDGSKA